MRFSSRFLAALIVFFSAVFILSGIPLGVSSVGLFAQAFADEATPSPEDPATTLRIKKLESELRCLVCQAQSVADSDSDFSQDVRREIDRMVKAGKSNDEIKDFLVQRYGDFILFDPPVKSTTALLWAGPAILLLIGAAALGTVLMRRRSKAPVILSDEDRRRAEALLAGGSEKAKGN
jgi:cytochrome c-type biogenesis protein CcmH